MQTKKTAAASEWWRIEDADRLDSPALVVYPERVKENIRLVLEMAGDPSRLRPHVKTHKSPDVTRLLLEAGIHKFKCATIAEAEMLAVCGAPDVLMAYQPAIPKARRLAALIKKYPETRFSCLIDHPEAAKALGAVFSGAGLSVPVWLDLNVGMNRTGILPGPEAIALYTLAGAIPGIHPIGLHAYDGHIHDRDWAIRKQRCDAAFEGVAALRDALREVQGLSPLVIAGGSPSFPIHLLRPGVECSPGTFVYWDKGYSDHYPEQAFLPAALVVTRVVSLPGETRLCLDLGHKSIAPENELARRVWFPDNPALQLVGQSEEHLVAEAGPGHGFAIGDLLYGMPIHICPTVALYEKAITIENGRISGEWRNTARDRALSI